MGMVNQGVYHAFFSKETGMVSYPLCPYTDVLLSGKKYQSVEGESNDKKNHGSIGNGCVGLYRL